MFRKYYNFPVLFNLKHCEQFLSSILNNELLSSKILTNSFCYRTPKFDKEEDPGASLMTLMKQMYDDGDDDMKRTIAKAWTEARDKKTPDELV